jgi:hypothetical protein
LARCMMQLILEWSHKQNIDIVALHASDKGFPLYESLGFTRTNEMRYKMKK